MALPLNEKPSLRRHFKALRASLTPRRRREASERALAFIKQQPHGLVLSYASFQNELDTRAINAWLAGQRRLVLPKVQGKNLVLYQVFDLCCQVARGAFGITEPIPERCRSATSLEITCALVPGLAFDASHQRLGYGGGYYDRFLPSLTDGVAYGLGFQEQLYAEALPVFPSDTLLNCLLLF